MKNLKVVFFGTPEFVSPILDMLKKSCLVVAEIRDKESYDSKAANLKLLNPDLLVVAAFGKIIPQSILDTAEYGALNIHPSLLPKFRGPSPIQAAILAGEKSSGVTIIKMDPQMDHGPVLAQRELEISEDETFESFAEKSFKEAAEILANIIPDYISGKLTPTLQDDSEATFCKMVKKEDGYFDIDNPPTGVILDRMIRAYHPWPGVFTKWKGKIVKFYPSSSHPELVSGSKKDSDLRQNDSERVYIQMEGKKVTDLKSFLNGYPEFPIRIF